MRHPRLPQTRRIVDDKHRRKGHRRREHRNQQAQHGDRIDAVAAYLVRGIQYERINEWYEMSLFEAEFQSWEDYLVRETKGDGELRSTEKRKIECGEKHFAEALNVNYRVVTEACELP